jgi:hypothetical protein
MSTLRQTTTVVMNYERVEMKMMKMNNNKTFINYSISFEELNLTTRTY